MEILVAGALKTELKLLLDHWGYRSWRSLGKPGVLYVCNEEIHLLRTGVGLSQTRKVLNQLDASEPAKILQVGVSGTLDPGLKIGDFILGTGFSDESGSIITPPVFQLPELPTLKPCRFVSTRTGVKSAEKRGQLRAKTGALAVDMESFAMAQFCVEHQIPLLTLRAISDLADDSAITTFLSHFRQQARRLQTFVLTNWEAIING